jgi:SAM-dependent methyltransferase
MTDQAERYDRIAAGYAQWWAPVLARDATALLEEVDADVRAGARDVVDIGTGTGTLAIAALRRWPKVTVTAVDLSAGMVAAAGREADSALSGNDRKRLRTAVAPADDLPFPMPPSTSRSPRSSSSWSRTASVRFARRSGS